MSESANWRDAPSWREGSFNQQSRTDLDQSSSQSWKPRGPRQGRADQRQPIVPLSERTRREDLKVHRPERQQDDPDAAKAIAEGRRIYLGNLLYKTTPEEIEGFLASNELSAYKNVHISIDPFSGRNPGYCFIEFADKELAEAAMVTLDGKLLWGRPVKCRPCQPKGEGRRPSRDQSEQQSSSRFNRWGDWNGSKDIGGARADRLSGKSGPYMALKHYETARTEGRQLFIGGLPRMLDQAMNEEEIRTIFKDFEIDAVSKRISPRDELREAEGRHNFCFVDFSTPEQAQAAIQALDGSSYRGAQLKVSMARSK